MKKIFTKILLSLLIIFTVFSTIFFGYLVKVYNENKNFDLSLLNKANSVIVTDRNGNVVANLSERYYSFVPYEDIPQIMVNAVLSVEDSNFFKHNGIDYKAMLRALIKNIVSKHYSQGASTITQQLVKNTYFTNDKSLERKISEIIVSLKLETILSKEQILEY